MSQLLLPSGPAPATEGTGSQSTGASASCFVPNSPGLAGKKVATDSLRSSVTLTLGDGHSSLLGWSLSFHICKTRAVVMLAF